MHILRQPGTASTKEMTVSEHTIHPDIAKSNRYESYATLPPPVVRRLFLHSSLSMDPEDIHLIVPVIR